MVSENDSKLTIFGSLERNLRRNPDKEAIVFRDRRFTYRQFCDQVDALAVGLAGLGVKKNDKVALYLPNWPEFLFAYFAIVKLGAIVVLLNTRYRSTEVHHILSDSDASVLIAAVEFDNFHYPPMVRELRPSLPLLRHILVVGDTTDDDVLSMGKLLSENEGRHIDEADIDPDEDVGMIMYTSGTTGRPKGAMIPHSSLLKMDAATSVSYEYTSDDVFLLVVPIFHITGMHSFGAAIRFGAKMVLVDVFKAELVLQAIEKERISIYTGVPTMFALELAHPNFKKYDLSSLRTGLMAGAVCPEELMRRVMNEMGCNAHIGYGMTETAGGITNTRFEDDIIRRTSTVGRPNPGVSVRIVDDAGHEVPHGEVGEITVKGPGVTKGYYKMPEATKEAFDDEGWFHTGDLGSVDDAGYVKIVGRKKEMIIRGGFNIYPREVEELLYTHPDIVEAALIGIPDDIFGERTCACVVPRPCCNVKEQEVQEFCRGKLADFKVPDFVRLMESLPHTSTGKISKLMLKEQIIASRENSQRY
ncbi:MAG: long-chain-fatty-acid--CoA ligase [Chloroflexi bacterium]|nr:long-chain-fatty-acid--CoA ligase [Chloroflexota bacterium]